MNTLPGTHRGRLLSLAGGCLLSLLPAAVPALLAQQPMAQQQPVPQQGVRYYKENGQTIREETRTVRVPVSENTTEKVTETYYRENYTTRQQKTQRLVHTPVTEYRWQPRVHNVLNPFAPVYTSWHMVPYTYWKTTVEDVEVPVTVREVVPEQRVVERPVTRLTFVERPQISRVVVAEDPRTPTPLVNSGGVSIAAQPRYSYGGINQLQSDPPRFPTGGLSPDGAVIRR